MKGNWPKAKMNSAQAGATAKAEECKPSTQMIGVTL